MKIIFTLLSRKLLLVCLLMLSFSGFAQNFTVTLANPANPTPNTFEVDVMLTVNAPVDGVLLSQVSTGINYNAAILNGGSPCITAGCGSWSFVAGTKDAALSFLVATTNTTRGPTYGHLRIVGTTLTNANCVLVNVGTYRLGKYRFTNTAADNVTPVAFTAGSNAQLWIQPTNAGGSTNTIVSYYVVGTTTGLQAYSTTVPSVATPGVGLSHTAAAPLTLILNPSNPCFTTGTYTQTPACAVGNNNGTATITMAGIPTSLSASYILDSGSSTPVTLTAGGAFTLTGLAAGAHTLTVTGNSADGCTTPVSVPFTIGVTPSVTPTFTQVTPICSGATLAALPTTSNNGVTGTWAPALNNTATTTYTFTPAAGQCSPTATMTITVNPTTSISTQTTTACITYTWPVNGTTYTTSGIYTAPAVLQSGIFDTLATWSATATANGATVTLNPMSGLPTGVNPTNLTIGGVAVAISAPGGLYSSGTFLGTNIATDAVTMTFTPPVYGVSGNYYLTNLADAAIAGNVTVTYSDGTVDTQAVTADTDFFGYFKNTTISSIIIAPVATTPVVNRWVSIKNLRIATTPPCAVTTLDLTITPGATPTFTQVAPICSGGTLSPLPTTSNNAFTGTWAPALNNTATTTYTFTPTVGQCASTATMTITVNPNVDIPTTVTACTSYTWAANGTTYTTSGVYTIPAVLQSGIFDTLATWSATATANGATVSLNPMSGLPTGVNPTNLTIGGVAVAISAPGGLYSSGTFLGTNIATDAVTMTFTPPVYGASGNYYLTNLADAAIAGTVTVTYSDGTVDTHAVSADTDFFGYFKNTTISSVIIAPVATTPVVNRWVSIKNLRIATAPPCQTNTLNLTINTPVAATFTQVPAICNGGTLSPLPTTSNNGFTGTWAPALNNTATTTYTFTPAVGQCATAATMTITVTPNVTPTFTQVAAICAGSPLSALPTTSNNAITGTWAPALNNAATTTYTFTPTAGQCATTATMTITVNPATNVGTQTTTACTSYTWPVNGTTYTTSGIYTAPAVLQSGIFDTLATWSATATANGATVSLNPMSGLPTGVNPTNLTIGGVAVAISAPGGLYSSGTFLGTNIATDAVTMTFTPPVYGVSGNYYLTNLADAAIAGTVTVTYSDGTVDTHAVSADTDFFGYFKNTTISSVIIAPVATTPVVNRWVSIKNLRIATAPTSTCNVTTLNLTINPAAATPTGSSTQSFNVSNPNNATIANLVVTPAGSIWYGSLANALAGTSPLPSTTVLTSGATYWAVNTAGGCPSAPFAVTVTVTLGNDEFNSLNFAFYPNPTSSVLNISYSRIISDIQVTNLLGQAIMDVKTNDSEVQIDLSHLAAATYFVKVTSEGKSKIVKVIKN